MQEKRQQTKLPSAWQPDRWVCHHTGGRQSGMTNDHCYQQSKETPWMISRNLNSSSSTKRISTAELKERIDKLSLRGAEYRLSAGKSKVKRLIDCHSPKSHRSLLSYGSRRPVTPVLHIPKMSKQGLKRWLDARDAYLGHQYPYVIEKFKHLRRRRQRQQRRKPQPTKEYYKIIDYEGLSMFSNDSDRFSALERLSSQKQTQSSRKESPTKTLSQFEISPRPSGSDCSGVLQRVKSFVQLPVCSLSRLSLRKQEEKKPTQIIRDHFDDKCIGTETSEPIGLRNDIERCDQAVQVDLARPQIELHREFDTSMVEGEKNERIRSVRHDVEYSDKATETECIINFANVQQETREGKEENEVNDDEDDKATRLSIKKEQEEVGPYIEEPYNVQQKHSLSQMADINDRKMRKKNKFIPSTKFTNVSNRIRPLTIDLLQTSTNDVNDNKQNGSQTTILTSTESNTSIQEQLQRYKETK
ncbi:unnamed protein product [Rotaria socialis]|uniref:Uncharacterized protein n=1 Tax=Rotaria socialis TaxID=392032 RepID=A0A817U7E2_9BILA|nr:unnamed protein product [Rotaria socialis]CAF4691784.1 unnamed protein product [Rotaria socialis]